MNRGAEIEDPLLPASSLWVVVSSASRSEAFELDGERRRAVAVGSCIDVDIRISGVGAAPVECFLVRDGDDIRLVPASAESDVWVGASNVSQPMRLWRRTVIEVAGVALEIKIREEPPTAPDHEMPRQDPAQELAELVPWATERSGRIRQRDSNEACWLDSGSSAEQLDRIPPSSPVSGFAEPPPSSTAPAMVSVRALSHAPVAGLEQLGLLTQRRPLMVALSGGVGAVVIAMALHWGAIALGVEQRSSASLSLEPAARLSPVTEFCAASEFECEKAVSSRSAVCGCLPAVPTTPSGFWAKLVLDHAATHAEAVPAPLAAELIQVSPVQSGQ
jgi:hypothetical protein